MAGCNCALSEASDGESGWEACAPYWDRHGVVRQGAVLREENALIGFLSAKLIDEMGS